MGTYNMMQTIKRILICLLVINITTSYSQETMSSRPPVKEPINIGWFPKTVNFSPDESNLIITACTDTWQNPNPQRCTVMRYEFAKKQWETLSQINPNANYNDVAYTFDGKAIFAHEHADCEVIPYVAPTRKSCSRLVLLDLNGKKLKNLTLEPHNTYLYPSLTRDGKKILYWGVSNVLSASMGGGAWDVKEFDIASQKTVQKTDYQAGFPKTTPRYMPDGKRLMLAAEEYPKRPNKEDFYSRTDAKGIRYFYDYVSKFGRNMTVVVDAPNAPIKPYFPTLEKVTDGNGVDKWVPTDEHMWLIVRAISRDGKRAVFDRRGVGMCFRFIEEPLRKEECFTRERDHAPSASIASSNKQVVIVSGAETPSINWAIRIINVSTGEVETLGIRP